MGFDPFATGASERTPNSGSPDPRTWDWISASKLKRSERRVRDSIILQIGPDDWIVEGMPQLSDHYAEYQVHRWYNDEGKPRHTCACQKHVGGQYRNMCTHIIATLIAIKDGVCRIQTSTEQENQNPKSAQTVEGTSSFTTESMDQPSNSVSDADTRLSQELDAQLLSPSSPSSPRKKKRRKDSNSQTPSDGTSSSTSGPTAEQLSIQSMKPALGATPSDTPGHYPTWVKEFRDFQVSVAQQVIDAFKDNDLVFLDGPTGSGKSLIGYMVGQMYGRDEHTALHPSPLYLCNDKALQNQFLRDFGEVGARTMMGRANYTPLQSTDDWGNAVTCDDCDRRDTRCTFCSDVDMCPYRLAKEAAKEANVGVLNYAYYLRESNSAHSTFSGRRLVIADECDVLEGIMLSYAEVVYSQQLRRELDLGQPNRLENMDDQVDWLSDRVLPAIEKAIKDMGRVSSGDVKQTRRLKRLRTKLDETVGLIDGVPSGNWVMTGYKTSRKRGDREGPIIFKPVRVNEFGQKMLFKHAQKWLLMSATIVSPEELVDTLGWTSNFAVVKAPMTFPVERRPVYCSAVGNMSRKTVDQDAPLVVNAVRHILDQFPDERAIIHTVSYDLTQRIQRGLEGCGRKVMTYRDSSEKETILERFTNTPSAVLIGPSIGRGTDFKDDAARINIICKVPYPFLGDKQVSTRVYDSEGGNLWYRTKTVREIVQMTGRTTRSETDWSLTYILDSQAMKLLRENKSLFPEWWREAATTRATPELFLHHRQLPRPDFLASTETMQ